MAARYLGVAVAVLMGGAVWYEPAALDPLDQHMQAEALRLRTHFDAVGMELRSRDVSHLDAQQRARRAQLVEWLRDYRAAGEFPLNDGYSGSAVPIFRDADGTLCAMAYLIDRSGRSDIVDRVAGSRNTASIRELADDPALVAWLDEWGLSEHEAARIQPWYGPWPDEETVPSDAVSADYALASMALAGTSLAASWMNVTNASRLSAALGVLAGGATVTAGLVRLDEDGGTRRIALANTTVGVLTIGAAVYGLNSLRGDGGRETASSGVRVGGADLMIAPDVIRVADRSAPGLVLQARF